MISDGSELLLLVPSISGIVGSIVLPVLGAVPDSLMVLFSGLSDNPQATVAVGVGALAGSTIMLLTVPWFLSVLGGRVSLNKGVAVYSKPANFSSQRENRVWEKLMVTSQTTLREHLLFTGVSNTSLVRQNSVFMLLTASLYLVIQVPALVSESSSVLGPTAWIGFALCLVSFGLYLYRQYKAQDPVVEELVAEARVFAIRSGNLSLLGAMKSLISDTRVGSQSSRTVPLLESGEGLKQMKATLSPFFKEYENQSRDKRIGKDQLRVVLRDLGMGGLTEGELDTVFGAADLDGSGHIDFEEFVTMMLIFVRDFETLVDVDRFYGKSRIVTPEITTVNEDADEDEEGGIPDDLKKLTPEEQQTRIKLRAIKLMLMGTLCVLFFADPAVAVMNEMAVRTSMNPFYISFVLAPLASNASEVIAAFSYAQRKTRKTIQVALTTLEGAAVLNNTFCLAIFLAIVASRKLEWTFTAEVVAIIFVQVCVWFMVQRRKSVFTLLDGLVILSLYPLSLLLVALLKRFTN